MDSYNIPNYLKDLNIWLCYDARDKERYKNLSDNEINGNKKAPRDLKGRKTTIKRCYTFNQCMDSIKKGFNSGLGIALKKGLVCIDYDNCIDKIEIDDKYNYKKVIFKSDVKDRITSDIKLLNSYTEISPSNKGIHIIFIANTDINTKTKDIEVYNNHFIRLTGNLYNDVLYSDISDRTQELDTIIKEYNLKTKDVLNTKGNQSKSDYNIINTSNNIYKDIINREFKGQTNKYKDADILETMFNSKNGDFLKDLYNNTISDTDYIRFKGNKKDIDISNSGKSQTLIIYLMHFSYGDLQAVKRLFINSKLCKSEYLEQKYYSNGQKLDKIDRYSIPKAIIYYHNYDI